MLTLSYKRQSGIALKMKGVQGGHLSSLSSVLLVLIISVVHLEIVCDVYKLPDNLSDRWEEGRLMNISMTVRSVWKLIRLN